MKNSLKFTKIYNKLRKNVQKILSTKKSQNICRLRRQIYRGGGMLLPHFASKSRGGVNAKFWPQNLGGGLGGGKTKKSLKTPNFTIKR
jgi:hypothetical protein